MAASIYTQAEIEQLIVMDKRAEQTWNTERRHARIRVQRHRRRHVAPFEETFKLDVYPDDDSDGIFFEIELCKNLRTGTVALTLYAQKFPKPLRPICRYEIDDHVHDNPSWCFPPTVGPDGFHRHVYSERAIKEDGEWDDCAEPLDMPAGGTFQQLLERIKRRFIDDLRIKFSDPDTNQALLSFGV